MTMFLTADDIVEPVKSFANETLRHGAVKKQRDAHDINMVIERLGAATLREVAAASSLPVWRIAEHVEYAVGLKTPKLKLTRAAKPTNA
jgi:hypothetical protein